MIGGRRGNGQQQLQKQVRDDVGNVGLLDVTPELVAQVTDKVYALLLQDLKVERERTQYFKKQR